MVRMMLGHLERWMKLADYMVNSPHALNVDCLIVLSEQTEGDEVEIGCPITCGDCKAVLLVKKFVCPGINVKCVKVGVFGIFFFFFPN